MLHIWASSGKGNQRLWFCTYVWGLHICWGAFELWKNHEQAAIEQEWKSTKCITLNICGSSPYVTVLPQDLFVLHFLRLHNDWNFCLLLLWVSLEWRNLLLEVCCLCSAACLPAPRNPSPHLACGTKFPILCSISLQWRHSVWWLSLPLFLLAFLSVSHSRSYIFAVCIPVIGSAPQEIFTWACSSLQGTCTVSSCLILVSPNASLHWSLSGVILGHVSAIGDPSLLNACSM